MPRWQRVLDSAQVAQMSKDKQAEYPWPRYTRRRTDSLPVRFEPNSDEEHERWKAERTSRGSRELPRFRDEDHAFAGGSGYELPPRSRMGRERFSRRSIGGRRRDLIPEISPTAAARSDSDASSPLKPDFGFSSGNSVDLPRSRMGQERVWNVGGKERVVIPEIPPPGSDSDATPPLKPAPYMHYRVYREGLHTPHRQRALSYSPVRIIDDDESESHYPRIRERQPANRRDWDRRRRGSYDNADSGSGSGLDSGSSDDAYSFTLSRHKRVLSGLDNNLDAVSEGSDGDIAITDLEKASTATLLSPKIHNIFQSKYTGEGSVGGVQMARLTVLPTAPQGQGQRRSRPPLFRWVHFEDAAMNFDDYQNSILSIAGLTDLERQAITRLLTRAKKNFDKPFQTSSGIKAKFMISSLIAENIVSQTQSKNSKPRVVTWMCLPHFVLQKYKSGPATARLADHPMRTLMQARFSLVQKQRDMQQAVCHLLDTPDDHCFHIAQTWYLVLDDSLLITCAGIRMSSLEGDAIKIVSEPSLKNHGPWPPCIVISCGRCLLWSFRVDECQTWFDFVSNFGEFWPRKLEFKHNGKSIRASDWPRIVTLARKMNVRLTLDHRAPSRDKFEVSDNLMPVEFKVAPKAKVEPKQQRDINTAYTVPRIIIPEYEMPGKLDPSHQVPSEARKENVQPTAENNPDMPTDPSAPGYFDELKPNPGTPTKAQDTLKPAEGGGRPSPKPDNFSDGFYVFTWLNAHPTTIVSSPPVASPPVRCHSQSHSNGSNHEDIPTPKARPEIQWNVDMEDMKTDLKEVDEFLNSKSSLSDRVIYQECTLSSRQEVMESLAKTKKKLMDSEKKKSQEKLKVLENKTTIAVAADLLFQFFLPLGFEGPTVQKYWGAIDRLIFPDKSGKADKPARASQYYRSRSDDRREKRTSKFGCNEWDVCYVVEFLGQTVKQIQPFKELYSQAHSTDRLNIHLPEEFPKAWLYLLICLASTTNDMMVFDAQRLVVHDLLDKGMRQVVQDTAKKSLLESLVFTPFELASLINFQLLEGASTHSQDIIEPYWQYLRGLEADIAANPLDRNHQDRIALFRQEIYVITDTLNQQRRMLMLASPSKNSKNIRAQANGKMHDEDLGRSSKPYDAQGMYPQPPARITNAYETSTLHQRYDPHNIDAGDIPVVIANPALPRTSELAPTHPNGVLGVLAHDALSLVDHKLRDVKEMTDWVTHLQTSNLQKIDTNKDRQEAAIYAFTIVTIVFLPLSTVAGILGMNTSDIRDMDFRQWIFWVSAVPLTVVVMGLCLVWAGEMKNFWDGFQNMWKARGKVVGAAEGRFVARSEYTGMEGPGMYGGAPSRGDRGERGEFYGIGRFPSVRF